MASVGSTRSKGRDLRGQVTVGILPGRLLAVVEPEAVVDEVSVRTVLDHEGATEAGDDAVVVAQPADGRGRGEGSSKGVGVDIEGAPIGRCRTARTRGRRTRRAGLAGRRRCEEAERGQNQAEGSGENQAHDHRRTKQAGARSRIEGVPRTRPHARVCSSGTESSNGGCRTSKSEKAIQAAPRPPHSYVTLIRSSLRIAHVHRSARQRRHVRRCRNSFKEVGRAHSARRSGSSLSTASHGRGES